MPKRKCDKHSLARSRALASGWRIAENAFLRFFVNCSNPLDNVFELAVHRHINLEPNPPGEAEGLRLLLLQKLRCVCWTMRSHVKKIKKEILPSWCYDSLLNVIIVRCEFKLSQMDRALAILRHEQSLREYVALQIMKNHLESKLQIQGKWVRHRHDAGTPREGIELLFVDSYEPLRSLRKEGAVLHVRRTVHSPGVPLHLGGQRNVWGTLIVEDWSILSHTCVCHVESHCRMHPFAHPPPRPDRTRPPLRGSGTGA